MTYLGNEFQFLSNGLEYELSFFYCIDSCISRLLALDPVKSGKGAEPVFRVKGW